MRRVLVIAAAVPLLLSCGGSPGDGGTTATDVPTTESAASQKLAGVVIDVIIGTDSGADRVENVALGASVTLNITNPTADDEFHLHGYDLSAGETPKGETATIAFTADKAGEFEVESHSTEDVILRIVVT